MSSFTSRLEVTPLDDGRKWRLLRAFYYWVGDEFSKETIEIPAGFITDFASSPRLFWVVVSPWGKYGKAAVVHDWLYQNQERLRWTVVHFEHESRCEWLWVEVTRKEADDIFLEAMEVLGVAPWRRKLMYWGVRAFGRLAWK
ncbi:hypothetical protein LCGC14_2425980 [marine sediment metagenome]|uniref:DUF1353 domain-containing protein n=1 Tax=marine sediment metagenome TaxID=412755 RepID=A0A0F9BND9_9ZZZZ